MLITPPKGQRVPTHDAQRAKDAGDYAKTAQAVSYDVHPIHGKYTRYSFRDGSAIITYQRG